MAVQTITGLTGFTIGRVSQGDRRAIGKLTDANHLESLHRSEPEDYDKKIITLYTQTQLYSNDFLEMINKSTPYYIEEGDSWKWDIAVPYRFPRIIEIPASTQAKLDAGAKIGVDRQEFQLVWSTNEFSKNGIIYLGSKQYGPNLYIINDPTPYNTGWLYTFTLISDSPIIKSVDPQFLKVGIEGQQISGSIGEFDQDLLGLGPHGDKITMFETLGSGYGFEHTMTSWADQKYLKKGEPEIMVYINKRNGEKPDPLNDVKWEPYVEYQMRKDMLSMKVDRMIWGKPGTTKSAGSKQELKRVSAGIYHKMRNHGNTFFYNRGQFSANMLRTIFGDLFYRRVAMKDRRVKMYTNEAGISEFKQAIKQDAMSSGLTFDAGSGNRFLQGEGQNIVYNFAFDSMVTQETGKIEVVHLKELDLPQTQMEFGQNKKSTPVFFVFDVSNTSDGSLGDNIREVRMKGMPSMTWGYIDGRWHHLGHAKSQGMSSTSMFPGYKVWMEDRCDVFIEDLTKMVLIEQVPQF